MVLSKLVVFGFKDSCGSFTWTNDNIEIFRFYSDDPINNNFFVLPQFDQGCVFGDSYLEITYQCIDYWTLSDCTYITIDTTARKLYITPSEEQLASFRETYQAFYFISTGAYQPNTRKKTIWFYIWFGPAPYIPDPCDSTLISGDKRPVDMLVMVGDPLGQVQGLGNFEDSATKNGEAEEGCGSLVFTLIGGDGFA